MSDNIGINTNAASGVTSTSSSGAVSVQMAFAMLQMELGQTMKTNAMGYIEDIKESQAQAKEYSELIAKLRNAKSSLSKDEDTKDIGSLLNDVKAKCDVPSSIKGTSPTKVEIQTMIENLQSKSETATSSIQQQMVFVQDYIGQYNSYVQGASSALSPANQVLTTTARGQ